MRAFFVLETYWYQAGDLAALLSVDKHMVIEIK